MVRWKASLSLRLTGTFDTSAACRGYSGVPRTVHDGADFLDGQKTSGLRVALLACIAAQVTAEQDGEGLAWISKHASW